MRKLIIFLIRKRLGLKKRQCFRFTNQKSNAVYFFTENRLMKKDNEHGTTLSNVNLNWILDSDCKIIKEV